jgi:hypothetical protein
LIHVLRTRGSRTGLDRDKIRIQDRTGSRPKPNPGTAHDSHSGLTTNPGPLCIAIALIGASLSWVSTGNSLPHSSKGPLCGQSPRTSVHSAARCVTLLTAPQCIIPAPTTFKHLRVHMHQSFQEQFALHATWSAPRLSIVPFTLDMSRAMESSLHARKGPMASFLFVDHTALDWCRLGLLTGSCAAEHAQTRLRAGIRFTTIPAICAEGIWVGPALASLRSNFVFPMTLTRSYFSPS